jgi:hypothetical protein
MAEVARTQAERKAVAALEELAKTWPPSLALFSWSGSLHVIRTEDQPVSNETTTHPIYGIPNDGGDP